MIDWISSKNSQTCGINGYSWVWSVLNAAYRHEPYLRAKSNPTAQTTETHADLLQAFRRYQRVVILGEPGAGKTFSLWRIAAEYAQAALKNQRAPLPVVIPLNLWTQPEQSLEAFVVQQMGTLATEFARLRHERRLLPLLDALNEIPHDMSSKPIN